MIEIDGGQKSGSGTIARDSVPFSILSGKALHLVNIRAKRNKPGLRPQHLKALEACAELCGGRLEGVKVGSGEITFYPGNKIEGGKYHWDVGTAGSTTMIAMAVLPLALFAGGPSAYIITGGLFQDYAPSAYHLQHVLFPLLRSMGAQVEVEILQPGYVPQGKGRIRVLACPMKAQLRSLQLTKQGSVVKIKGIALSSLLASAKVSERMAGECRKLLKAREYEPEIRTLYDTPESSIYRKVSVQAGAALSIWAETTNGCLIGSDMAGAKGRISEFIGRRTAENLLEDLSTGATVDRHLANMVIPYAALAEGWSHFLIPRMTEHIESRLWLVETILGARIEVKNLEVMIRGIGFLR